MQHFVPEPALLLVPPASVRQEASSYLNCTVLYDAVTGIAIEGLLHRLLLYHCTCLDELPYQCAHSGHITLLIAGFAVAQIFCWKERKAVISTVI